MSAEELLIWMSAREKGSWPQFRSAVDRYYTEQNLIEASGGPSKDSEETKFSAHQMLRFELQRLAHVEFNSAGTMIHWRVAPPSLAVHEIGGEWKGVLCGARHPKLMNKLAKIDAFDFHNISSMPDKIICIYVDLQSLIQTTTDLGLTIQLDAPASILAAIPPVDDPRCRKPEKLFEGPGWIIQRFSTSKLAWVGASQEDPIKTDTGLFRYRMKYRQFSFLRWRGKTFEIDAQAGKFIVLKHRGLRKHIVYDSNLRLFAVPASLRPPLLIERALILCTGSLPHYEKNTGRLEYSGIPIRIAQLASELLRQQMPIR